MIHSIFVQHPNTKQIRRFTSVRAVARMLSGNGKASGGLRKVISANAMNGMLFETNDVVRKHRVAG